MNLPASSPHAVSSCDHGVLVIGAGPAGSITALQLMKLAGDCRVLIVDREEFPRGKVCGCCLNGAAVGALDTVGLGELPETLGGIRLSRWQAKFSWREVEVPLPSGWAISREALDASLLDQVRRAGAEVRTGVVARLLEMDGEGVTVELKSAAGPTRMVRAAVVVIASGLSGGGVDHILPWRRAPAGPVGLGTTVRSDANDYAAGTIYMACDPTGYAGLVRLEDGRLDVAAAVYEPRGEGGRRTAAARVAAILRSAGMPPVPEIDAASWRGTPRLHRQRQPGRRRVIAVGDAAGYVEPFTGEGMAWGMQTGLLAARTIAEILAESRPNAAAEVGTRYAREYRVLLSRRRLPCRILTAALRPEATRRMLFQTLSAAPWLAAPVVRLLNRPTSRLA